MCVYTCIYIFIHTFVFVYVWMCRSTYLCMYSGMCLYICINMYTCNNIRIQIHTYKHNVFKLFHIVTSWGRAKPLSYACPTPSKCHHRAPMASTSLESTWPYSRVLLILQTLRWNRPTSWWGFRRRWTFCAVFELTLANEAIAGFHPTGSPCEKSA